jgi:hypothetical protein
MWPRWVWVVVDWLMVDGAAAAVIDLTPSLDLDTDV